MPLEFPLCLPTFEAVVGCFDFETSLAHSTMSRHATVTLKLLVRQVSNAVSWTWIVRGRSEPGFHQYDFELRPVSGSAAAQGEVETMQAFRSDLRDIVCQKL